MNNKRIFLSYNYNDKDQIDSIVHEFQKNSIDVWFEFKDLKSGINWNNEIRYQIESSDTLIVFLSKNFINSKWSQEELAQFINESQKRNINIIPVALERVKVPNDLSNYSVLNLYNSKDALNKLIYKAKTLSEITFDKFSPWDFENFIKDFLKEYGFTNIRHQEHSNDIVFDYKADYKRKSPFGINQIEHWLIEVKFYKKERFSINAIQQLIEYKRNLVPADLKLLLITNTIFTSVVEEYLKDFQKIENTQIEVIDGLLLKKLIVNRKNLLNKYFEI